MMRENAFDGWNRYKILKFAIISLVILSLILIVVGHCLIVGQVFDPGNGELYNVFTRWVSDFAAKNPEGWWIKGGIFSFCIALALFFRRLAMLEATEMKGVWRGFVVLVMGTLMIGGLVLVAVFDLSPKKYEIIESHVVMDRARVDKEEAEGSKWWEVLFDPKAGSLREEILEDSDLSDEELVFLRGKVAKESWTESDIRVFMREKLDREKQNEKPEIQTRTELRAVPKEKPELTKHWYHRMGFQLFLVGFVFCSLWFGKRELLEKRSHRLPGTLLGFMLTLIFGLWLLWEKLGLAGIPQRALLGLIGYWLIRNLEHVSRAPERVAKT